MVFMRMGIQNGVEMRGIGAQHLVPEIWCGINDDGCISRLDQDATAQSFVLPIG